MTHQISFRVRYGETDQMGVVHHGNYALYFEMARIEWMRELGVSYKAMEESGIALPVVNLTVNYRKPLFYDDELTVTTQLKGLPTATIKFEFEIQNQNKELCSTAEVTLVFLNNSTRKPMRCPQELLERIQASCN
ncbi:MAG: thioesterase family protein [Bacteroidetes bacterium]|nr:thioesterase family protein [Bacteroidota bacterium]MDA0878782.1 thioesterase family protein [Bacteroidota bacterium]